MTKQNEKEKAIKELQTLMNIGPATSARLYSVGIISPSQLKKTDPEEIYAKLKEKQGGHLDICVLYQLRGAVRNIPWWNCQDEK